MQNCKRFLKQEPVFVIAAVCAVVSMLWVPPSAQYLEYIDLRVLELLFCLMAAVAGMQQEGTFLVLSQRMLAGRKSSRLLTLSLVMLPFFASMLITNDVALIAFVPFGLTVLHLVDQDRLAVPQVVLQTLVASMASLISYKLLVQEYPQQRMRYLGLFTFLNLLFLGLLYTMSVILRS